MSEVSGVGEDCLARRLSLGVVRMHGSAAMVWLLLLLLLKFDRCASAVKA
jgi:hypothetical protein